MTAPLTQQQQLFYPSAQFSELSAFLASTHATSSGSGSAPPTFLDDLLGASDEVDGQQQHPHVLFHQAHSHGDGGVSVAMTDAGLLGDTTFLTLAEEQQSGEQTATTYSSPSGGSLSSPSSSGTPTAVAGMTTTTSRLLQLETNYERKKKRAKINRKDLNSRFQELMDLLHLKEDRKLNRAKILEKAIEHIENLSAELEVVKASQAPHQPQNATQQQLHARKAAVVMHHQQQLFQQQQQLRVVPHAMTHPMVQQHIQNAAANTARSGVASSSGNKETSLFVWGAQEIPTLLAFCDAWTLANVMAASPSVDIPEPRKHWKEWHEANRIPQCAAVTPGGFLFASGRTKSINVWGLLSHRSNGHTTRTVLVSGKATVMQVVELYVVVQNLGHSRLRVTDCISVTASASTSGSGDGKSSFQPFTADSGAHLMPHVVAFNATPCTSKDLASITLQHGDLSVLSVFLECAGLELEDQFLQRACWLNVQCEADTSGEVLQRVSIRAACQDHSDYNRDREKALLAMRQGSSVCKLVEKHTMGIPRFYRYMSERYPLLNQPISDVSLLPEFDAFYLDMNGIVHNCTHSDAADDALNSLSLQAQLHGIFTYLDRLITHIIKPKQLVYIAIDGVAPRAKLNQQRSRRFRAGLDRQEAIEKERYMQIKLEDEKNGPRAKPAAAKFDSNCITPGTEFLDTLSQHLVYFVRQKMKTDPLWARLEVFFSGSEVPGEGEHKIVEFIRHRKMAPGYEANVRHCMYGSDADLMLLGLMTHEPHFTLVRETVVWGSNHKKVAAKQIEEQQWQLVHLSLFREYLMLEMRVQPPLDGERMLDDFILLTFLLGNDFIPHSPTLEISEDAIPLLLRVYRELLETHGGSYLTFNGKLINLKLLQELFQIIGSQEEEILINRSLEEKRRSRRGGRQPASKQHEVVETDVQKAILALRDDDDDDLPPALMDDEDEDEEAAERELLEALDGQFEAKLALEAEENEREVLMLAGSESFQDTKWNYYERKYGIKRRNGDANNKELEQVKKHYMEALVW
ncbi:hypothetical protein BBJ28_00019031, partial [Nothophytophthora sp. Chile5]